ncbi:MAG: outer membrane beta-barrel protein [Bacteroidales bacterium]|nr:outer membrane beta-barrel protein [Bacteroidales bacterium]
MTKRIFTTILLLCAVLYPSGRASAQQIDSLTLATGDLEAISRTLPDEYLDTVQIKGSKDINDYSLLGFAYGVDLTTTLFNPQKYGNKMGFRPNYLAVFYTHHEKMFRFIPYFAIQIGAEYSHSGFSFDKESKETLDGISSLKYSLAAIPAMAQIHVDMKNFKVMAMVGAYAGYRFGLEMTAPEPEPDPEPEPQSFQISGRDVELKDPTFMDSFRRFDYGLRGGVGFGVMFDPVEIHLGALVRWSWSSLYAPDYYSKYYYRFAYPLDISIYASFNFQLNKRTGNTTSMLKKKAKSIVYGED